MRLTLALLAPRRVVRPAPGASASVVNGGIRFGLFGPPKTTLTNLRPIRDVWREASEAACA